MKTKANITNFEEKIYLKFNPDVKKAVKNGIFKSGKHHYVLYGHKESRKPFFNLDRKDKIFYSINKNGLGLEIGPSHNPIAPKKDGFKVHILDHMSKDQLRKKYKNHDVNINNIEEVDFVWHGESYQDLIGKTNYYDWIISSHVIEHTPDLISHLQQCEALLKPKGILSLVIPDKRYCFDHFLPVTFTGEILDAFQERRIRPSPGQIFNYFSSTCKLDEKIAWNIDYKGEYKLLHDYNQACNLYKQYYINNEYVDVHCWRFIPTSFKLLITDLQKLQLTKLNIKKSFETHGCEFYMSLEKSHSKLKQNAKLKRIKAIQLIKSEDNN